uniref:Integrase core domain-containing protein n=1 Tax=Strigamia maritima TaxID=126957 RepID=T1IL45_STRMM
MTMEWKDDEILKQTFTTYSWSMRTLKRRLQFFGITRTDKTISPSVLLDAVKKEIETSGKLLGYRSMHRKLRNEENLFVARNDVYLAMNLIAPEYLEERQLINKRKKFRKRTFTSKGSNFVWSLDGHDKLMGRNKAQFPLAIHGCVDTFSRKILWLKNLAIKHYYIPNYTRSDRSSENVLIATIQNYLHASESEKPNHLYGTSTSNQVIEQWWRGFRERQGEFYKDLIHNLINNYYYDENASNCRVLLAALYIPIIQKDLDSFKNNWNVHRIRKQKIYRPCGVVRLLYEFPEQYGR